MIRFLTDLASINPLIITLVFLFVFAIVLFLKHNIALVACCLGIVFFSSILFSSAGQDMFSASKNLPTKPEKAACFFAALKNGVPIKAFPENTEACSYRGQKLG